MGIPIDNGIPIVKIFWHKNLRMKQNVVKNHAKGASVLSKAIAYCLLFSVLNLPKIIKIKEMFNK